MKTIIKLTFLALTIFTIGCSDPCSDVDCGTNGTCDEGTCICEAGYEGASCESEIREKYIGTYSGSLESCLESLPIPGGGGIPSEFLSIQAVTTPDPADINNVELNTPNPLLMLDSVVFEPDAGIFIIPLTTQNIDVSGFTIGITANGSGKFIDENTLEISLNLTIAVPLLPIPIPAIQCVITMTKV